MHFPYFHVKIKCYQIHFLALLKQTKKIVCQYIVMDTIDSLNIQHLKCV